MKKILSISIIIATLAAGIILYEDSHVETSARNDTAVLSAQIKSVSGQIIDVRELGEYIENHADGAINIPLNDILNRDYSKIDKSKPIYVYCRSGIRAGKAKIALEKAGYKNVTNLGGLNDWTADGGLTCGSNTPKCK